MKSYIVEQTTFQYSSDLHFEIWGPTHPFEEFITPPPPEEKDNTYLILAGDLAPLHHKRLREFLQWCSSKYAKIFYVSGNHEYYFNGKFTIPEMVEIKRELCAACGDNIVPLEDETYVIERDGDLNNILIIGSTLWSQIPMHYSEPVYKRINDFRQIKHFDIETQNDIFAKSIDFIDKTLESEQYKNYTKIIITHHSPLSPELTVADKYRGDVTNVAFCTDLEETASKADAWIYGHTHYSTTNFITPTDDDEVIKGPCIVSANCRGHPGESYNLYDPNKKIYL